MRPKKKLGQYFLMDKKILKKIVDFAQIGKPVQPGHPGEEDTVIEIGPGQGNLTELLLEKAKRVIAVEKDSELIGFLEDKFCQEILKDRLRVIEADILEFPLKGAFRGNYVLVGNIPYYITGEIFRKFLESENPPKSITFVVQKEVAERIMARDGKPARPNGHSGRESVLSISIKAFGTPEYGGTIKAGSFVPKPKVDSAIISIRNINKNRFKEITPLIPLTLRGKEDIKICEKRFFEIVKRGFAHKRKLLIKNLNATKAIFQKCGIQEYARAEELSVDNWICLAKALNYES